MKIYLTTLALTLLLAYLADTTITRRPFSISFGRGVAGAGNYIHLVRLHMPETPLV